MGSLTVAKWDGQTFANSTAGDMMLCARNSNEKLLFGSSMCNEASMTISQGNVMFADSISIVNGACNVQLLLDEATGVLTCSGDFGAPNVDRAVAASVFASNVASFSSNSVVWASNATSLKGETDWASNASAFGSNFVVWGSNAAVFGSNLKGETDWASNAGAFGSNSSVWASNAASFGSNLNGETDWASNAAYFGSNSSVWASNAASFGSNLKGETDWGSNAGAFGSNAGAFGSNAGAFGSNAGAFGSNAGAFGSNAGAFGSNAGAFGSNAGAFGSNAVGPATWAAWVPTTATSNATLTVNAASWRQVGTIAHVNYDLSIAAASNISSVAVALPKAPLSNCTLTQTFVKASGSNYFSNAGTWVATAGTTTGVAVASPSNACVVFGGIVFLAGTWSAAGSMQYMV